MDTKRLTNEDIRKILASITASDTMTDADMMVLVTIGRARNINGDLWNEVKELAARIHERILAHDLVNMPAQENEPVSVEGAE